MSKSTAAGEDTGQATVDMDLPIPPGGEQHFERTDERTFTIYYEAYYDIITTIFQPTHEIL